MSTIQTTPAAFGISDPRPSAPRTPPVSGGRALVAFFVLAYALSWRPLVFVGEASYCLYLLHFNLWNLVHDSHLLDRFGLARFDPWISYVLLIGLALVALHLVEKPAQRVLRGWMDVWRD